MVGASHMHPLFMLKLWVAIKASECGSTLTNKQWEEPNHNVGVYNDVEFVGYDSIRVCGSSLTNK